MKFTRNKKIIAAVAVALTLAVTVGGAAAYFSDYESALGEVKINLSKTTTTHEEVDGAEKSVQIANSGKPGDANVVVRVIFYGPKEMKVTEKGHWAKGSDGYYYYDQVLAPNDITEAKTLVASVEKILDEPSADLGDFEVIVQHESAYVTYNEDNQVNVPEGWNPPAGFSFKVKN